MQKSDGGKYENLCDWLTDRLTDWLTDRAGYIGPAAAGRRAGRVQKSEESDGGKMRTFQTDRWLSPYILIRQEVVA